MLSNATVQAYGSSTSSLQVLLNRLNPQTLEPYTDLTPLFHATGGDTRGDAVAIGYPGWPDGNGFAFIATSKATARATVARKPDSPRTWL